MTARTDRRGFTLLEALCVVAIVAILFAAIPCDFSASIDVARATSMKNKGRGIWIAVVSANSERKPLGLCPVWPQEMGFMGTNSSTAYFQCLMADSNSVPAKTVDGQLVSDLKPEMLAGTGVPVAKSGTRFASANNAWCVTCVSSNTPAETAFLFLRNLDAGAMLSSTSRLTFPSVKPQLKMRPRAIWITRGGGVFDAREKYVTAERLNPSNCPPVAVMRP